MPITARELEWQLCQPAGPTVWPQEMAAEFIAPRFDGFSLVNVPATAAELLGYHLPGVPPLDPLYWQPLAGGVTKVVILLLDALGFYNIREMMRTEADCVWRSLAERGLFYPMTSVCPSTTTTALSCLGTGVQPVGHGLVGYEM